MDFSIDRAYLVRTLADLVRIDSTNPSLVPGGAGEAEIAAYVAGAMQALSLEVTTHEPAPGRVSVVGRRAGRGGGRALMLNAHTDTVGVEGMAEPFAATVRQGRLYGRGAQDMKGSLAACLAAVKALQQARTPLRGDVLVAAVADEEYASLGTADVLRHYRVDGAVVTEPTDLAVCLAHKGFVWIEVETTGRAAHGSRPDEGIDANLRMGRVLAELEALGRRLRARPGHPLTGPPSLHVGTLAGGTAWSVYAAGCTARLERRIVPGETEAQAVAEVQSVLDRLAAADPAFEATLRAVFVREPFVVSQEAVLVQAVAQAAAGVLGRAPAFAGQTFWTDAALLAAAGVETTVIGPVGAGLHTRQEWVDLDSLVVLARILAQTARSYCGDEQGLAS